MRVTGGASVSDPICQILADVFDAEIERLETGNSAGLGAAMRAAQAVGAADWPELSQVFCKPAAGRNLRPIPANVRTYAERLPEFAEFADSYEKDEG